MNLIDPEISGVRKLNSSMEKTEQKRVLDIELSRTFAKMGFVSAAMIVYLHTGSAVKGESCWILHNILHSVCSVAIPWFFFAAGFFLALRIGEQDWYLKAVVKRIRTLLVPFWIWGSIIFCFYCAVALIIKHYGYDFHGKDYLDCISVRGLLRVAGLDYAGNMPTMWFLRTLFIFVVLSPLLYKSRKIIIGMALIAYLLFVHYQAALPKSIQYVLEFLISLRGLFYFLLGILYAKSNRGLNHLALTCLIAAGLIFLCLHLTTDIKCCSVLMVPGLMAPIFHVCSRVSVPQWLTSTSFGVYVTHSMLAYLMFGVFSVLHIGRAGETLFVYGFLRFLLVCGSAVVLVCALKRIAPNVSRIMFGGR